MNAIFNLIAVVLFFAVVAVLLVVAETLGLFEPPQTPSAYRERLEIAREIIDPEFTRIWGPDSNIRETMAQSITKLEDQYPQIVADYRGEVDAIYANWVNDVRAFSTTVFARFYADHFTADDLRAMRDKDRKWRLASIRRVVVWQMNKGKLEEIGKHTELYNICRLVLGVSPALAELGIPDLAKDSDVAASCADAIDKSWIPSVDAPK